MQNFNWKILFLSVFAISLGLILYKLNSVLYFPDSNWKLNREEKIAIETDKPIIQKFKSEKNNLTTIEILFGHSGLTRIQGQIHFQILEENCEQKIADSYLNPHDIKTDNTNALVFDKISDSANKVYCLKLSFNPSSSASKNPFVFINPNDSSDNMFLSDTQGNELKNQSLSMRLAYKNNTIWQDATELNKRISQYKPWFLKHYYLGFIFFSFIILSITLAVILVLI